MALGGNKTRQLEYILGHVLAEGYDCVIQGAASQSNHARQLAAAGAKLGLEIHLTPWQDARSRPVQGNYLLSHLYGAVLHPLPPGASNKQAKADLAQRLRARGKKPYIVGMGAHEALVLATVAYVDAFLEIVSSWARPGRPIGCSPPRRARRRRACWSAPGGWGGDPVVGINPMGPDHEAYSPPAEIRRMALDAAARLGRPMEIAEDEVVNLTDYVGEAYGIPSAAGLAALDLAARTEGLLLDPVYSSKGFSGLVDHVGAASCAPASASCSCTPAASPASSPTPTRSWRPAGRPKPQRAAPPKSGEAA
jgi:L-cysteate sulfo-lyase